MATSPIPLRHHPEVAEALAAGDPVVALETTVLAHGLPWPHNLDAVRAMQKAIRDEGAVPAVIGICAGRITIGLDDAELDRFARSGEVAKASRRDLALLVARGADGATTVAGTMVCAAAAGIQVFATGGIGGVHRGWQHTLDVSADLQELARSPVAVVCSGAKAILDLPATLEALETQGVPVVGFGTRSFPAFFVSDSGLRLDAQVEDPGSAAALIQAQRALGGGILIANPVPPDAAIPASHMEEWLAAALAEAEARSIRGKSVTPFLLERIAALSDGRTLAVNQALLESNARVAARIALALPREPAPSS